MRVVVAGVLAGRTAADGTGVVPVAVDLNRAPVAELAALPGIGPVRAAAIVLHRVRHGPFAGLEDLAAVDGIGPDTVAGLRRHVRLDGRPLAPAARPTAPPAPGGGAAREAR